LSRQQQKKWHPKGGKYYVAQSGRVARDDSEESTREFGVEYPTREQAERALVEMRKHNRLLAYVMEHDPDWKPYWDDTTQKKAYVFIGKDNKYDYTTSYVRQAINAIYMSPECARALVNKLNNNEVEL